MKIRQFLNESGDNVINLNDADEVSAFIEYFFIDHGLSSASSRLRIEKLLRVMPITINSQKEITSWVRKNWDRKLY